LAQTHELRDFREALTLLRQNYVDGQPSLADLEVEVQLLASRREFAYWVEALAKLLKIRETKKTLPPNLRMTLAQLYDQVGRWDDARKEMQLLTGEYATNPAVVLLFVDMYLAHNELDNAETYLKNAERIQQGGTVDTLRRRAALLSKQGKTKDAVTRLLQVVPADASGDASLPPEQVNLIMLVGSELEKLEQWDAAEKLIRRFAAVRPTQVFALAQFLARRGGAARVDEAFAIAEKFVNQSQLVPALQVSLIATSSAKGNLTDRHKQQVEAWFQKALREEAENSWVDLRLAELRSLQGKHDEAFAIYRRVLDRKELDSQQRSVTLNNLAYLLAANGQDLDAALRAINEAIAVVGELSDLMDTRGFIRWRRGELREAADDLHKSIGSGVAAAKYFHQALIYHSNNDVTSSDEALRKAVAMGLKGDDLSELERKELARLQADQVRRSKKS
jgi:tetratricopeptide (TPR) repeat protein